MYHGEKLKYHLDTQNISVSRASKDLSVERTQLYNYFKAKKV
jgi:hypothetical protein